MRTPKYVVLADVTFTGGPRKGEMTTIKLYDIYSDQGFATLAEARAHTEPIRGGTHIGHCKDDSFQINHTIVGEIA